MSVNPTFNSWNPDMIPEMLLIDAFLSKFGLIDGGSFFKRSFEILDQYAPKEGEILLGTISNLNLIPEANHVAAVKTLKSSGLYDVLIPDGLKHGLALYPEFPIGWLLDEWKQDNHVDWEKGTLYIKEAIQRMWEPQSVYSTQCRMFVLVRLLYHRKLNFVDDLGDAEYLPDYPNKLTEEQKKHAESWVRASFSAIMALMKLSATEWTKHFWRQNYQISPCERFNENVETDYIENDELSITLQRVGEVSKLFVDAFEQFVNQARLDIYEPDRDEVVFGLSSRQFRLYSQLATIHKLWTYDSSKMIHRAMVDTLVTLKWLVQQSDKTVFSKFKEYSVGNTKLAKLKVEEMIDKGETYLEPLAKELSFLVNEEIWEEFVNINLADNFAGTNFRQMAIDTNLKRIYDLIYSPASSVIHGEWVSLKRYNMRRCSNPLHRFHRVPELEPPMIISPHSVFLAGRILLDTFEICLSCYNLSHLRERVKGFLPALEEAFKNW
jgi:hypothetical protein